jgi:hypothetical protein
MLEREPEANGTPSQRLFKSNRLIHEMWVVELRFYKADSEISVPFTRLCGDKLGQTTSSVPVPRTIRKSIGFAGPCDPDFFRFWGIREAA